MAGSSFGDLYRITTWGESHGAGIGCVIDGAPAGFPLQAQDIQTYLDRRRPGQSAFSTPRKEADRVEILSGVFEGKTTGTPIALEIRNENQRSGDYSALADKYRPGHADYGYDMKYGFRDYRGGGRSSGRETAGRVAGGAVAALILKSLGITFCTCTIKIGDIEADPAHFDASYIPQNDLCMPDREAYEKAAAYLQQCREETDSAGGIAQCIISGVPAGLGDPVFEKLDANLAKAVFSIGAVKGFEIGSGFSAAEKKGSENNDPFGTDQAGQIRTLTNNCGGILGGISTGGDIIFRAAFKPTPSIAKEQQTVNSAGQHIRLSIHGRHDPVIVPRAVVVVETMAACVILDAYLKHRSDRLEDL